MSASDNTYGLDHLVGKTFVPRVNNPTLRGSVRRNNPDGGHASPYYTSLSGTSLTVEVSPVGDLVINFVSDEIDDAITTINAVSSANLQASDEDGYLRLTNLNGGSKNFITIKSGTAATILGFVIAPEPGSTCSAGEVESSPPGRGVNTAQNNPQGTVLIGADENLTSRSANRAYVGILSHIERIGRELDVEIPAVKEFSVTVGVHAGSGKKVFFITNSDLRIPLVGFQQPLTADFLDSAGDQYAHLLTTDRKQVIDVTQNPPRAAVLAAYNNDGSNANADNLQSFVTYGTYDGRSIFGDVIDQTKHVAVPITAIRGDLIIADTATFTARFVQPGDTVLIEGATNNSPFNHNGEFVVTETLGPTKIRVRAKSARDDSFVSNDKPTALNSTLPGGATYGTVTVLIGNFYTAGFTVMFEVPAWVPNGNYRARVLSGVRLRSLPEGALAKYFEPNQDAIIGVLRNHIALDSVGFRHVAVDVDAPAVAGSPNALSSGTVGSQLAELLNHLNTLIAGEVAYGGGIDWADGTPNPATNLEAQVDKILNDLAAPGVDGVAKIRGLAINFLSAGTLRDQLIQLENEWFKLSRVNTVTANQTSNNATWTYGAGNANDKPSLAFSTGATSGQRKLFMEFGPVGPLRTRIYINDFSFIEMTVNAVWAPGTTNWSSDDVASNSLRFVFQGDRVRGDSREAGAGTWTEGSWTNFGAFEMNLNFLQGFFSGKWEIGTGLLASSIFAEVPRLTTFAAGSSITRRTLLWQAGSLVDTGHLIRIYAGDDRAVGTSRMLEFCFNCFWNNASGAWFKDDAGANSASIRFGRNGFEVNQRDTTAGSWNDTAWTRTHPALRWDLNAITLGDDNDCFLNLGTGVLSFDGAVSAGFTNPASNSSISNELRAKNICKGWAVLSVGVTTPTVVDGFNITSVSYVGTTVLVTIAANMADGDYAVLVSPINTNSPGVHDTIVPVNLAAGSFVLDSDTDLSDIEFGERRIYVAWFGEQL